MKAVFLIVCQNLYSDYTISQFLLRNRLFVNQIIYEFEKIVISLNIRKMTSIRLKEPLLFSKILLAWVLPGLFATTTASKKSWSQIARTLVVKSP